MNKVLIALLFFVPFSLIAQDVYVSKSPVDTYLFIDGIDNNKKKLLDLKDNTVIWLRNDQIQQIDKLTPWEFGKKIFDRGLVFHASGNEPFWDMRISHDELWFNDFNGIKVQSAIQVNINKDTNDNQFILIFNSVEHEFYGVIRGLWGSDTCENNLGKEKSVYEVFINYQGRNFSGCAILERQDK